MAPIAHFDKNSPVINREKDPVYPTDVYINGDVSVTSHGEGATIKTDDDPIATEIMAPLLDGRTVTLLPDTKGKVLINGAEQSYAHIVNSRLVKEKRG